jgi:hypothetical protein
MAYTVGRFWVEAMRDDVAHHFLGMRINNWTSIIVFLGALIYFMRVRGPQQRLVVTAEGEVEVLPAAGAPTATSAEAVTSPQAVTDRPDGAAETDPPVVDKADVVESTPATAGETRPSNQ